MPQPNNPVTAANIGTFAIFIITPDCPYTAIRGHRVTYLRPGFFVRSAGYFRLTCAGLADHERVRLLNYAWLSGVAAEAPSQVIELAEYRRRYGSL